MCIAKLKRLYIAFRNPKLSTTFSNFLKLSKPEYKILSHGQKSWVTTQLLVSIERLSNRIRISISNGRTHSQTPSERGWCF